MLGLSLVLNKIVECWMSFFADRAMFYRAQKGSLEDIAIAVVIQQMIDSKKSGVLFTADPVHAPQGSDGGRGGFRLGRERCRRRGDPDHYALDRKGTIKRRHVVGHQVLTDPELKLLADLGRQLERIYGCPQDIEWAFDHSGNLFLLQSRPSPPSKIDAPKRPLP